MIIAKKFKEDAIETKIITKKNSLPNATFENMNFVDFLRLEK